VITVALFTTIDENVIPGIDADSAAPDPNPVPDTFTASFTTPGAIDPGETPVAVIPTV
jgi:hypothetical protein